MERLLEAGAQLDAKDLKGRTALHLSCARGDMGCIENILLQSGASGGSVDAIQVSSPYCQMRLSMPPTTMATRPSTTRPSLAMPRS